jgi:hypothetical protein
LYFGDFALRDKGLGIGRRSELGLIWHELGPVEDILAGGAWSRAATSRPDVEAATYSGHGDVVVLLVQHAKDQHRCVAKAETTELRFWLPWQGQILPQAIRLSPRGESPRVEKVEATKVMIAVSDFDIAEGILLTASSERANAVRTALAKGERLGAELALATILDHKVKTEVVCERMRAEMSDELCDLLRAGSARTQEARDLLACGNFRASYDVSRRGLLLYRRLQSTLINEAWSYAQRKKLPRESWMTLNVFYALPLFFERYKGGAKTELAELGNVTRERWRTVDAPGFRPL